MYKAARRPHNRTVLPQGQYQHIQHLNGLSRASLTCFLCKETPLCPTCNTTRQFVRCPGLGGTIGSGTSTGNLWPHCSKNQHLLHLRCLEASVSPSGITAPVYCPSEWHSPTLCAPSACTCFASLHFTSLHFESGTLCCNSWLENNLALYSNTLQLKLCS